MERAGNRTLAIQSMVLREVVETHLLLATRSFADAKATVSKFSRLIRSFRKLLRLVQAGDDVGAQKHWQAHMEVAARSLLPDQLKSATVLELFG
jgi:DNA-binding GntR family transcriptional regulator